MKPKENKEKQGEPLQSTKEILSNQWDSFLNGGNTLPLSGNAKRLRAMVGRVLLVVDIVCWCGSDAEGTKGNGRLICVAIPSLVMRRPVSWDELKK